MLSLPEGLSFFETMSGELLDQRGAPRPVCFEIKAEASQLTGLARQGVTRISGVIDAPPWASAALLEGTLEIAPRARRIAYAIAFCGDDGRRYQLSGRKQLSLRRPLRSLTRMRAALSCDGAVLARGSLRFDLRRLGSFLRSFWPASGFGSRSLRRPLPDGSLPFGSELDRSDRERLAAMIAAIFALGDNPEQVREREALRRTTEAQLRYLPGRLLRLYKLGLRWLDGAALARHGRAFKRLSLAERQRLLERPPPGMLGAATARFLTLPPKTARFSEPGYLAAIGQPPLEQPPTLGETPTVRYMRRVRAAEELTEAVTELEAEVVVVGTGAGGAALAAELAGAGVAVALIEEGRYHGRERFAAERPLARMRGIWRRGGMSFTVGQPPIALPLGRAVGGTTTINSGTCIRAPDELLRRWWRAGLSKDFLPERLARHYQRVERELEVAPGDRRHLGQIAEAVARGAEAMGMPHGPLPRNAPGCDGQGSCIFGCPTGAKRSTDVSYVPRALRAGAELYVGLPVRRVLMQGRRAVGVEARGSDGHGAPRTLRVRAERVVLACGSVYTPLLLRDSGLSLPQLGNNLSLHPALGMIGRFDQRMLPWQAIPQGYGAGGAALAEEGIRLEGFYLPPALASAIVPFVGERLVRWMAEFDHCGGFGLMVHDEPTGRVQRDTAGRPLVRYTLSPKSLARLQHGAALLAELLLRGGAREVLTGIAGRPVVRGVAEARALKGARVAPLELSLLGAHPLGTCRMGRRVEEAVVDEEHRVFGTDNLYVVDGSVVPTPLGVNPQLTIMALATRAAEILAAAR